jgi:hypothetical protein
MFRPNDLTAFFGAFGVTVQVGTATAKGIFDKPSQTRLADHGFGGIDADLPSLRLPSNAFALMPSVMDTLIVDGRTYTVADRHTDGDGAIFTYSLKGPIA